MAAPREQDVPYRGGPAPEEPGRAQLLARTPTPAAYGHPGTQRAWQASETHHRAMIEASPECIQLVAADGTLLQVNRAALQMLEADSASGLEGQSIYALVAPEYREPYRDFHQRVCGGEPGTLSFDIVGLRGARRSLESSSVPLTIADGSCCQLAFTRDVTQRLANERSLAHSRARLELTVLLSGIGFWHCDLPFDELVWDTRVKEHFFLEPSAQVTIADFYKRLHPDDRAPTRAAIESAIAGHGAYDVIYRAVDPLTGRQKWIRALGGALYDADGTPTRFDGVTIDVSAQKEDQQRLAELNAQLTEHDRRKNEFLATLAHELRNPLAPVRTGLDVLQRGGSAEEMARVREMMERQLRHLVRLVDDLLDVSRITLGKVTLKKERIDIRAVVLGALEATRAQIEAKGHELVLQLAPQALFIEGDLTRLTQVIVNLIGNAVRYTPSGGRIEITTAANENEVMVRISDTGIGIPEEMLPRVFDLFTQAHPSSQSSQGGLGLGLTLARGLVEMHGGLISAASAGAGAGSTFSVSLPLGALADAGRTEPQTAVCAARKPLRILVVDDNADAAETVAMLLRMEGHDIRMAHTGESALHLAAQFSPNAVLLDLGLPGLNGYEVARLLRQDAHLPQPLTLIALTGWGSGDDRRAAEAAGFDHHLMKPVAVENLLEALSR